MADLYFFSGHGIEKNKSITLKKNQYVIMFCKQGCTLYIDNMLDKFIWNIAKLDEKDYLKKLKTYISLSNDLCLFKENDEIPNLELSTNIKADEPDYRYGLFKVPISYKLDKEEKKKIIPYIKKRKITNKNLELDWRNFSRYRTYLDITSYHNYYCNQKGYPIKNLTLKKVIQDIEDNIDNDDGFILVLYTCRDVYKNKLIKTYKFEKIKNTNI